MAESSVALPPATAERTYFGREGTVVLLAFVVITMILGTATYWLGSH